MLVEPRAARQPRSSISSATWLARPTDALGPGIRATRAARRVRLHEEVELVVADLEPRSLEDEVARSRDLLEAERATVEAARALEIGDDQPAVLEALSARRVR